MGEGAFPPPTQRIAGGTIAPSVAKTIDLKVSFLGRLTPCKINMEPKNDPIEKEIKSSSKHPCLGTILIFQGINEKFNPKFYTGLGY